MNHKHLAIVILGVLCLLAFQGVSKVRQLATKMQEKARRADQTAKISAIALVAQKDQLDELKRKSADTLGYLQEWEPHLAQLPNPEAGESYLSSLIKEADLMLLAQRFEVLPNKALGTLPNQADATLPRLVRAHLSIEDDYVKTLNWLGDLESKLPISRISNVDLARGQSGNDLRMNIVVDLPLAQLPPSAPAQP